MTDSENTKEYTDQSTLGVESSAEIQNQTTQSLESLEGEVKLTPEETEAINKIPDYNLNASPEEQEARIAYFTKMKNDLLAEVERQGERSPLSQALQEIEKNTDKDGKLITDPTKIIKTTNKTDFERLIIYLGNKSATKSDMVTCSAIDIGIWLKDSSSSSYLINIRDDYFHIGETVKYKEKRENTQKQITRNVDAYTNIPIKPQPVKGTKDKPLEIPERIPLSDNGKGFDIHTMKSLGIERSDSGVTLCSRTAWRNLTEKLGLKTRPPRKGSALETMLSPEYENYTPLVGSIFTPHHTRSQQRYITDNIETVECTDNEDIINRFKKPDFMPAANCGEIYLSSKGHPQYGHRAGLCKGDDGKRYVLDPYVGRAGTKAQPLETYLNKCESKGRKVYRVNLFQSQA